MKKLALSLTSVALAVSMALTGCGSSSSQAPASSSAAQQSKAASSAANPPKQIVFKLADNQPLESPLAQANVKFSEYVKEKTNGAIKIDVYPSAQLGEEAETTEQVKAGVLDFARINVIQLTQFVKDYEVYTLPYMFANDAHKWKVIDGEIGKAINAKLTEKTGIQALGFLDSGWRCFYTKKEVKSLAGLKGMKIRVMDSAANINMIKALGATPTPMPYADVFTALQTGVIDGAENDYVSYKTSGHHEVAKFYAVDRHTAGFGVLIMSNAAKSKLTPEQYKIIQDGAKTAIDWQRTAMVAQQDKNKEDVIKTGSKITEVDIKEFQNAVAPMYDAYKELKPTIEKIRALQ